MAKRARSSVPQFRVRVPSDLLPALKGKRVLLHLSRCAGPPFVRTVTIGADVSFSLATNSTVIAEGRQADALRHLRKLFDLTAAPPIRLSHRDMVALSGEAYRLWVAVHEDNPGQPLTIRYRKALDRAALEGRICSPPPAMLSMDDAALAAEMFGPSGEGLTTAVDALPAAAHDALEDRFGLLADWVLIHHGVHLSAEDRQSFLRHVGTASLDAGWQLRRNAEGDYTPDPKAARFPPLETVQAIRPRQTITGLFGGWAAESLALKRSDKTRKTYGYAINRLVGFLGHDDASRLTQADMIRYKDHRLAVVSAKSFRDGDLPALKQVFRWGVRNQKIASSPVAAVAIPKERHIRVRSPGFSDREAQAIFAACIAYQQKPKESETTAAAKRWAPLIAAYTGCRIREALQLRKCDVSEIEGHHVLTFSPEAGTIKTGIFRVVPIHDHLMRLGFLHFVNDADEGPLFAKGSYERVVQFVREVVPDGNVQPNHAWRHRFKTIGRNLGLDSRIIDGIQGHAPRSASDDYGDVTVIAMSRVIAAMPAIAVGQPTEREAAT